MTRSARRALVGIALTLVATLVPIACATNTGSQAKFCAALPKTGDLMSILNDFSSTDPKVLASRFRTGLARYQQLERDAPHQIRGDVATVTAAVQEILDVVEQHPDDLSAIRTELTAKSTDFASAGKAADNVATYAHDKCGISLTSGRTTLLDNPDAGVTTTTTG